MQRAISTHSSISYQSSASRFLKRQACIPGWAVTESKSLPFDAQHSSTRVYCFGSVFSSTLFAPSFVFCADLCTIFLLSFFVALPVFLPASLVDLPASLMSCLGVVSCLAPGAADTMSEEIGRASCRARV